MTKFKCASVFGLILVMSFSWSSRARVRGGSDVGGGKALVCRRDNHSIKSVELLDLWEARVIDHKPAIPVLGKPIDNLDRMMKDLRNINLFDSDNAIRQVKDEAEYFLMGGVNWISGAALSLTDDSFELIQPIEDSKCRVEQVVVYTDLPVSSQILVNQDIYKAMDATNQLALALHESIYSFLRTDARELSSRRTRRVVANLMTGTHFESLAKYYKKPYIECSQENLSPNEYDQTYFDIVQIDGGLNSPYVQPIIYSIGTPQGFLGFLNLKGESDGQLDDIQAVYDKMLHSRFWITTVYSQSRLSPDPEAETVVQFSIGPNAVGSITLIDNPDHLTSEPSAVKCVLKPAK